MNVCSERDVVIHARSNPRSSIAGGAGTLGSHVNIVIPCASIDGRNILLRPQSLRQCRSTDHCRPGGKKSRRPVQRTHESPRV